MCKTKTLIYTFTNRRALDECLDDINRNYADKELSWVEINTLKGKIPSNLTYGDLCIHGYKNDNIHILKIGRSFPLKELRNLAKNSQNLFGEIDVTL